MLFSLVLLIFNARKYHMHYLFSEAGFVLLMRDYLTCEDLLKSFFENETFSSQRGSEFQLSDHDVKKMKDLKSRFLKHHLVEPTEKVSFHFSVSIQFIL